MLKLCSGPEKTEWIVENYHSKQFWVIYVVSLGMAKLVEALELKYYDGPSGSKDFEISLHPYLVFARKCRMSKEEFADFLLAQDPNLQPFAEYLREGGEDVCFLCLPEDLDKAEQAQTEFFDLVENWRSANA
jgi:hypothetical protein